MPSLTPSIRALIGTIPEQDSIKPRSLAFRWAISPIKSLLMWMTYSFIRPIRTFPLPNLLKLFQIRGDGSRLAPSFVSHPTAQLQL